MYVLRNHYKISKYLIVFFLFCPIKKKNLDNSETAKLLLSEVAPETYELRFYKVTSFPC